MTLCTDCKHYDPDSRWRVQMCNALNGEVHPVHGGRTTGIRPDVMRMTLCGWRDPKFFEPKEKQA